ncbi:MAG: hypothetical protein KDA61_13990, partial [Planctomycetales bacterium]|nr:hypothetical protein [Planctomycetales bacterium]
GGADAWAPNVWAPDASSNSGVRNVDNIEPRILAGTFDASAHGENTCVEPRPWRRLNDCVAASSYEGARQCDDWSGRR